ncbi:DUF3105 domain-containing protein [Rhodococcus hoagii]|nr:DUF3105 domain-containing protein [Prescottella equi]
MAYDRTPPFGGPHDAVGARARHGVRPADPQRERRASLEHGAVWITYDPALVTVAALDHCRSRRRPPVSDDSPYPGLSVPVSLQSGDTTVVDGPTDARIDHFVDALRLNRNTFPERARPAPRCRTSSTQTIPRRSSWPAGPG